MFIDQRSGYFYTVSIDTFLWILAVICWAIAAISVLSARVVAVNLVALGLVFAGLTHLLG